MRRAAELRTSLLPDEAASWSVTTACARIRDTAPRSPAAVANSSSRQLMSPSMTCTHPAFCQAAYTAASTANHLSAMNHAVGKIGNTGIQPHPNSHNQIDRLRHQQLTTHLL